MVRRQADQCSGGADFRGARRVVESHLRRAKTVGEIRSDEDVEICRSQPEYCNHRSHCTVWHKAQTERRIRQEKDETSRRWPYLERRHWLFADIRTNCQWCCRANLLCSHGGVPSEGIVDWYFDSVFIRKVAHVNLCVGASILLLFRASGTIAGAANKVEEVDKAVKGVGRRLITSDALLELCMAVYGIQSSG